VGFLYRIPAHALTKFDSWAPVPGDIYTRDTGWGTAPAGELSQTGGAVDGFRLGCQCLPFSPDDGFQAQTKLLPQVLSRGILGLPVLDRLMVRFLLTSIPPRFPNGFSFLVISLSPSREVQFYRFRLRRNKVSLSSGMGCCSFDDRYRSVDVPASSCPGN
jgi:hypothetical protein